MSRAPRPVLKAALNGARVPDEHPALPITPEELARDGRAACAAGADALHVHVRAIDGEESLASEDVARTLAALREACPGTPIGISTGAWILPDPAARIDCVEAWSARPDFASVNFHEARADALAERLLARGIAVEAGLWHPAAAERLIASRLGPRCLRVLIEPMDAEPEPALATAAAIEGVLDRARLVVPRLLHGTGATAWALLGAAASRGLAARIGLEDTLVLPDGRAAPDNAALVAAARAWLDAAAPR